MAAWTKPNETAVLTVNGADYADWESVMVRCAIHDAPPFHCRFTCSEGVPIANNFAKMQIMPGMDCSVKLAGLLAFTGKVETRQVYYDANRHHIEIICASNMDVITTSVISQTGESKMKTFKQLVEPKLNALGIKLKFINGSEPSYKFPRVSETPGESLFDYIDALTRQLGLHLTSNPEGDFVVVVGPGSGDDSVVEGRDIIVGREILYRMSTSSMYPAMVQGPGNDQKHGPQVAQVFQSEAVKNFMSMTFATAPAVIRNEMASSDKSLLTERIGMEQSLANGDKITVFATVHGWLRRSGAGLWKITQRVSVTSPMLVMNNESLNAKSITFTQDNQTGSRTLLELCNPAAMGKIPPTMV